jgi:hypothetical protein
VAQGPLRAYRTAILESVLAALHEEGQRESFSGDCGSPLIVYRFRGGFTFELFLGILPRSRRVRKLLAAATSRARPFDYILIADSSRISRSLKDTLNLYEQLSFAGIRIVTVSQGVDRQSRQAEILVGVHGLIDAGYTRELARRREGRLPFTLTRGVCRGLG